MKQKSFIKVLAYLVIAVCLVILIFLGISGKFTQGTSAKDLNHKASQEIGQKIVIPHYQNYPMLALAIKTGPYNRKTINFSYGQTKGKLLDQRTLKGLENQQHSQYLYGLYRGNQVFSIEFEPGHTSLGGTGIKTKMIDHHKIHYLIKKRSGGEFMAAVVDVKKGSYSFTFNKINDQLTVNNAFQFINKLLKQL